MASRKSASTLSLGQVQEDSLGEKMTISMKVMLKGQVLVDPLQVQSSVKKSLSTSLKMPQSSKIN